MSEPTHTESFEQRFRRLREAAGLTKTALAGDRYTTSYVSQIEAGRRRPAPDALAWFAHRLGVTPRFLSTGIPDELESSIHYRLEEAARLLQAAKPEEAIDVARGVIEDCERFAIEGPRGTCLAMTGQCLVALGRVREGIDRYEEALEHELPERSRGIVTAALAVAYRDVGDLSYAADLIEGYLRGRRDEPLEAGVSAELNAVLISIYFERGDMLRAERAAGQALAATTAGVSAHVRADVLWNASRVLAEQGRYDEALGYARRARAILDDLGDQRRLGLLHNAYAFLCLEAVPPRIAEAEHHLATAQPLLEASGVNGDLAHVFAERARLFMLTDDANRALDAADASLVHVHDDDLQRARSLYLRARALAALSRSPEALDCLHEAAAVFQKLGARQQEASCWREAGELQLAAGRVDDAVEALRFGLLALDPSRSRA